MSRDCRHGARPPALRWRGCALHAAGELRRLPNPQRKGEIARTERAAGAAELPFSFQAAEFLSEDQARAAGEAWARARLPPGLTFAEARVRANAAGMTCGPPRGPTGVVACRSSMVVQKPGGVIGEDTFALRLLPDGGARLAQARLSYTRDGVAD